MAIPALAAIAGRTLMGLGADMAGPAAARSAAGSVLKVGSGAGIKESVKLKEIAEYSKNSMNILKKVSDKVSRISPMFDQQIQIIVKSLTLFLRPILDILGKFLRPMAIWMIKVAIAWNNLFGTGAGKQYTNDALDQATKALEIAKEGKDTTAISNAQAEVDKWGAIIKAVKDENARAVISPDSMMPGLQDQLFPVIFTITKNLSDLGDNISKIYDEKIAPGLEIMKDWANDIWDLYIAEGFKGLLTWATDIWDTYIVGGFKGLLTWAKDIWDTYIVGGFKGMLTWAKDIWDTYIVPIWNSIKSAAANLIKNSSPAKIAEDVVTRVVNGVTQAWNAVKKIWETKAVGGPVRETGLYNLHAGERIMTAGDTQRSVSGNNSSTSVNNYININAAISNEIDIRTLARKLAEYSETEIRRRVSYT